MGKKSFRSMYLSSQREVEVLKKKITALEDENAELSEYISPKAGCKIGGTRWNEFIDELLRKQEECN